MLLLGVSLSIMTSPVKWDCPFRLSCRRQAPCCVLDAWSPERSHEAVICGTVPFPVWEKHGMRAIDTRGWRGCFLALTDTPAELESPPFGPDAA